MGWQTWEAIPLEYSSRCGQLTDFNDEGCIQASYDELIKYLAPFNKGSIEESKAVYKSPTHCPAKLLQWQER